MLPDLCRAGRVVDVALEFNAPPIQKRVKPMGGRALIHTHGARVAATLLECAERSVVHRGVGARSGHVVAPIAARTGCDESTRDDEKHTRSRHVDESRALSRRAKEPRFHSMPTAPEPLPEALTALSPA